MTDLIRVRLLNVREVALLRRCAASTVTRALQSGALRGVRIGKRAWAVRPEDLAYWEQPGRAKGITEWNATQRQKAASESS